MSKSGSKLMMYVSFRLESLPLCPASLTHCSSTKTRAIRTMLPENSAWTGLPTNSEV